MANKCACISLHIHTHTHTDGTDSMTSNTNAGGIDFSGPHSWHVCMDVTYSPVIGTKHPRATRSAKSVHSIPLLKWVFYHCSVHPFYTFSPQSRYMTSSKEVSHSSALLVKQVPISGKPVATSGQLGILLHTVQCINRFAADSQSKMKESNANMLAHNTVFSM